MNPQDHHQKIEKKSASKSKSKSKKVVSGFRGFHRAKDLSHPSLHNPKSARNRALTEVVGEMTATVFGEPPLRTGGFKAAQGAEALGLIGKGWQRADQDREALSRTDATPTKELSPQEREVAAYAERHGTVGVIQVRNLIQGNRLDQLAILADGEERREIAAWVNANPWVRRYMSEHHLREQLAPYGLK